MNRRRYLSTALSTATAATLAGCSSSGDGGGADGNESANSSENESNNESTYTGPASFEIISIGGNGTYQVGDRMQLTATIKNTGGKDGTFSKPFEVTTEQADEWFTSEENTTIEIPSGETRVWEGNETTVKREDVGTYKFRFVDTNRVWEITMEPKSYAPTVKNVSLVENSEEFDGELVNTLSSAQSGPIILVGWTYEYIIQDGSLHVFEQCRVFDNQTNERVGNETYVDEQVFGYSGFTTFEHGLQFNTDGWGPGEYRAEVTIRDEISGDVSTTKTTTFELT